MQAEFATIHGERAAVFKALSDPLRIEMIKCLIQGGNSERNCGELGEHCGISKPNASYHFRILREAGLIHLRKESQFIYIRLEMELFEKVVPGFLALLADKDS